MAITINTNTVSVPRNCKDSTLPWTAEMRTLAENAERKDALAGQLYTFGDIKDARRFYLNLLTKPNKR
jgi:hypothetical protein